VDYLLSNAPKIEAQSKKNLIFQSQLKSKKMNRILNFKLAATLIALFVLCSTNANAQTPSKVDFDAYLNLAKEVQTYRQSHLVSLDSFLQLSKGIDVIILDTRSKEMFEAKHIKGAINLNFSDFTQANLAAIIPDFNTKILIYCNNNFSNDRVHFATKGVIRVESTVFTDISLKTVDTKKAEAEAKAEKQLAKKQAEKQAKETTLTLALNIPTFINLYGYGYKNVFELSELVSVFSRKVQFEGTAVVVGGY
jgi:Rhodanese-like domain